MHVCVCVCIHTGALSRYTTGTGIKSDEFFDSIISSVLLNFSILREAILAGPPITFLLLFLGFSNSESVATKKFVCLCSRELQRLGAPNNSDRLLVCEEGVSGGVIRLQSWIPDAMLIGGGMNPGNNGVANGTANW